MNEWEEKTCLRFVPRTNEENYIEFVDAGFGKYEGVHQILRFKLSKLLGTKLIMYFVNSLSFYLYCTVVQFILTSSLQNTPF